MPNLKGNYGTSMQIKNKVTKMMQERNTSFRKGIHEKRTRVVNSTTMTKFYANLESIYKKQYYLSNCIWNLDETWY